MSLLTNLQAYYKLEDATDATGGTTLTTTGSPTYTAGKIGNALNTGSANTTIDLYRTPTLLTYADLGTAWTFAFWFKITTGGANQVLTRYILNSGGLERNFTVNTDSSNIPSINCFDGSVHGVAGTAVSTGTWYHLVTKYDSGTLYLYINGSSVGTPLAFSWSGYARTSYSNFSIGADQLTGGGALSSYFSGLIDEFGVWNRALSGAEITELYASGSGNQYPFVAFLPKSTRRLVGAVNRASFY